MKILRKKRGALWSCIGHFASGDVVVMKCPVNQFCTKEDLYIISEIPECYLRDAVKDRTSWVLSDKIPVTNLRTGGVSLVQQTRPCRYLPDAHVVT